jgi:hypothetical protein
MVLDAPSPRAHLAKRLAVPASDPPLRRSALSTRGIRDHLQVDVTDGVMSATSDPCESCGHVNENVQADVMCS